ncbi:MAG TPA: hypothetical protein VGX23_20465 [Actinocrinis sp.]|nr:hypothetical protein [Actinocrinis sp.]
MPAVLNTPEGEAALPDEELEQAARPKTEATATAAAILRFKTSSKDDDAFTIHLRCGGGSVSIRQP